MPISNEEFIKKAFEAGLGEDEVRQAVTERNKVRSQELLQPQTQSSLGENIVGGLGNVANFLFPNVVKQGQKIVQGVVNPELLKNEPPPNQPTELAGMLAGPGAGYLLDMLGVSKMPERQRMSYASGADIAPLLLGVKAPSQIGPLGALVGGSQGLASPQELTGIERAKKTGVGAGVGYITGKTIEGSVNLLKSLNEKLLSRFSTKLLASQYNVPRSTAGANDLPGTIKKLGEYGITNIDDIPVQAAKVTGNNGVITQITRETVANSQPVETAGLIDLARNIVADETSLPSTQDEKVARFLYKGIESLTSSKGRYPKNMGDPLATFEFIQKLESKAASMTRGRLPNQVMPQDVAQQSIYRLFADELTDRLYQTSGADKMAIELVKKPEYIQKLAEVSPKLAEKVSKIKTLGELRSLASPFVRGDQLYDVTQQGIAYGLQNVAGQSKGLGKILPSIADPGMPLRTILSSGGVNAAAGQGLINAQRPTGYLANQLTEKSPLLLKLLGSVAQQQEEESAKLKQPTYPY